MQTVSHHGIQISVPAAWKINNLACGTPIADTVIIAGAPVPACATYPTPTGLTVVRLGVPSYVRALATEPVVVDGHSGRLGSGTPAGERAPLTVLVLPDLDVGVSVASPDPAAATRIPDSVRVVPVDSYGCVDRVDMSVPPVQPVPRFGATQVLVPGRPIRAAVCRYDDGWLMRSAPVTPTELDTLVDTLNGLPVGVSRPGPGYNVPPEECAKATRRGYVVHFGYPEGPPMDVHVHVSGCNGLSTNNGARTTRINKPLVDLLISHVSYSGALPNPAELR